MTHSLFPPTTSLPADCPRCHVPSTQEREWTFIGTDRDGRLFYVCSRCAGELRYEGAEIACLSLATGLA